MKEYYLAKLRECCLGNYFLKPKGTAPIQILLLPEGHSHFRTSGGEAAPPAPACCPSLLPSASCSCFLLLLQYGKPPVKIRAKLRIGTKLMIFWNVFSLFPGTTT